MTPYGLVLFYMLLKKYQFSFGSLTDVYIYPQALTHLRKVFKVMIKASIECFM